MNVVARRNNPKTCKKLLNCNSYSFWLVLCFGGFIVFSFYLHSFISFNIILSVSIFDHSLYFYYFFSFNSFIVLLYPKQIIVNPKSRLFFFFYFFFSILSFLSILFIVFHYFVLLILLTFICLFSLFFIYFVACISNQFHKPQNLFSFFFMDHPWNKIYNQGRISVFSIKTNPCSFFHSTFFPVGFRNESKNIKKIQIFF